jgi:type II secretory pathway pseudopilin PulG
MHPLSPSLPGASSGVATVPLFRRRRSPASPAFTLLEVMIAATVMALAITTSITTMQRAFAALDSARKTTLAGQIMQSELERMRLENWDVVNGYPGTEDITASIPADFAKIRAITDSFIVTREVAEAHTDMKRITLTTSWTTHDGRSISRSYSTHYGRNGLYDYFYNSF